MNKLLHLILAASLALFFNACDSADCEEGECLNGGKCVSGSCICQYGFSGTTCETIDDTSPTIDSPLQFAGFIDSTEYNFVDEEDGSMAYTFSTGASVSVGNPGPRQFGAGITDTTANISVEFKKGSIVTDGNVTLAEFEEFWAADTCSFSDNAADGVEVSVKDEFGTWWRSSNGAQTGLSSFEITDSKTLGDVLEERVKVRVEVTCLVYDGTGNAKEVSGVFVLMVDHTE